MSLATGISPAEMMDPRFDFWADLEDELARRWTPYEFHAATVQILHNLYRAFLSAHGAKTIPDPIEIPPQGDPPPPMRVGIRDFARIAGRGIEESNRGR